MIACASRSIVLVSTAFPNRPPTASVFYVIHSNTQHLLLTLSSRPGGLEPWSIITCAPLDLLQRTKSIDRRPRTQSSLPLDLYHTCWSVTCLVRRTTSFPGNVQRGWLLVFGVGVACCYLLLLSCIQLLAASVIPTITPADPDKSPASVCRWSQTRRSRLASKRGIIPCCAP